MEDASDDVVYNYPRNIGNERQGRKLAKQIQIKEKISNIIHYKDIR
jgi:hypothetical protein